MLVPEPDPNRRNLIIATSAAGAGLLVATAIPFIQSMEPSAAALAAGGPVEAELNGIEPGKLSTVEWRSKPVWILHRSESMLAGLQRHDALLADPASTRSQQPGACTNPERSLRPPWLVLIGICTHLGCVPSFRPETAPPDLGPDWPGGFYCPCHGSRFDLAGRVFRNVPAPINLEVPPYRYLSDSRLQIGEAT